MNLYYIVTYLKCSHKMFSTNQRKQDFMWPVLIEGSLCIACFIVFDSIFASSHYCDISECAADLSCGINAKQYLTKLVRKTKISSRVRNGEETD